MELTKVAVSAIAFIFLGQLCCSFVEGKVVAKETSRDVADLTDDYDDITPEEVLAKIQDEMDGDEEFDLMDNDVMANDPRAWWSRRTNRQIGNGIVRTVRNLNGAITGRVNMFRRQFWSKRHWGKK